MRRCIKCNVLKNQEKFSVKPKNGNICKQCKSLYAREYYLKNKQRKSSYNKKYRSEHKEAHRRNSKKWVRNNKLKIHLRKYYKISVETYSEMLTCQNKKCAVCKKDFTEKNKPNVDHCHKTNKVRGLLCSKCNFALGFLNDDISLFNEAIKYLQK